MSLKQKKMLMRICAAVLLTLAAACIPLGEPWRFVIFLVPYLTAGYDVLRSALRNIIRGQVFDEKFLMAVATVGALAIGEYPEAAGVMIFYQIGELFESVAVGRSRRSIAALMDIRPEHARILRGDEELCVSPEEVQPGDCLIVRPGDRIPVDGRIIEGRCSLNTAALTGESIPLDCGIGDRVISGSINLDGLIRISAESRYEDSTVARILELVENSAEKKAKVENFITRFARYYTPIVVSAAVILGLIPPLILGHGWGEWIKRALIFLMVSCPCALVVSVPLSFFGGIGSASRQGILIKGASYMEVLSKARTVVFDKTGTLTVGSFEVERVCPRGVSGDELLNIAALGESYSSHPIAESLVRACKNEPDKARLGKVSELAGMGIEAEIDGQSYFIGNAALMERAKAAFEPCESVGTVIYVSNGEEFIGSIIISDRVKPEAAEAIAQMKTLGVKNTVMLTGDRQAAAESIAQKLGIDRFYAQLLPAQKVEKVEELLPEGWLAFVGDGINDAPVLTRADVGIAMGAMGSDAAIESADIVLMDDKLAKLPLAIRISRRTMRIVRENIVFSLGIKAVILLLAALGAANMWIAIFGDVGVLVLAVLNSMRTMFKLE